MHPLLGRVPRLQMLAVFECAARLGSFTDAATELGMTQSGVSRHVSALEQTTGLNLFLRSPNRVQLSSAGESLLIAVQRGFDSIETAIDELSVSGPTFLLAANPGFAQRWLIPYLDELQAVLGEADLRLRLFDRDSELTGEVYDAAIHLASTDSAPPTTRVLFDEIVVPVAAPDFAVANGLDSDAHPTALLDVEKLHLDGRDRKWMDWAGWFAATDVAWTPRARRMSYNNYPLVINDAIAGRGVALAWTGLVEGLLATGTLVVVGPHVRHPGMAYQLFAGRLAPADRFHRLANWLENLTG